jgi:hypothetical protein
MAHRFVPPAADPQAPDATENDKASIVAPAIYKIATNTGSGHNVIVHGSRPDYDAIGGVFWVEVMKILPRYREDEGAKCVSSISLFDNVEVLSVEDAQTISNSMESCTEIDEWLSNIRDPIAACSVQ